MSARPKTTNGKSPAIRPAETQVTPAKKRQKKSAKSARPAKPATAAKPAKTEAKAPASPAKEVPATNGKALGGAVESFALSFKAVGKGARAVNAKLIDIAQTNVNTGLEFARDLAGARTPLEVMRLQMSYWHEYVGAFETQARRKSCARSRPSWSRQRLNRSARNCGGACANK